MMTGRFAMTGRGRPLPSGEPAMASAMRSAGSMGWTSLAAMVVGLAVIYAGGVSWLAVAHVDSLSTAMAAGLVPFVILDLLKLTAAAMILPQAWRSHLPKTSKY